MFQRRPALRFVLLFIAGILAARGAAYVSPAVAYTLTAGCLVSALVCLKSIKAEIAASVLLQLTVVLSGFFLQRLEQVTIASSRLDPAAENEPIVVFGKIDSEPVRQEKRFSCVICTDSVVRASRMDYTTHRIMVNIRSETREPMKSVELGQVVKLEGILEPFPFQRNPGEFNYGKYLSMNDVQGVMSVKGWIHCSVASQVEEESVGLFLSQVQKSLYNILDSLHTPRHAGFIKGIIFGYRADIPPDVKQSFLDTGTIHILAVSGSNVAFVTLVIFSVLGFFRLPRRMIIALTVAALLFYMLLTGSSASVVRATIMAIVLLIGTLLERKPDIYNSISVAAMLLLLWNTNTLFDIGFQLSFSAVISIVFFYPRLERVIMKIPERYRKHSFVNAVLKLFAVSLAAQIGTIPFSAYYFGRVSIISLVANIPVVPLSGLNTFIGCAELAFAPISHWMAGCYAAVNDLLVWFLLGFVKQAASVPYAYLSLRQTSIWLLIGYYVFVISLFHLHVRAVRVWLIIVVLLIGNYSIFAGITSSIHQTMMLTMLDVGQGDALLLEFPNGKRVMTDTGPISQQTDAGARIILPYLKRRGIDHLHYLLITHPHADHEGGAASLLRVLKVDTLVLPPLAECNQQTKEVLRIAQERNIPVVSGRAGMQLNVGAGSRMYLLHPSKRDLSHEVLNNISLVAKAMVGTASVLLVGDAEMKSEEEILKRYGHFPASDILKIGHHGSPSSSGRQFLETVQPQTALISVGNHNKFKHPSPLTLRHLESRSIEILRTDKCGAIVYETDGTQWTRVNWRNE